MVVCDVNPAPCRGGRRGQLPALPGRRLERPPARIPDQTPRRGPRKDARSAAGATRTGTAKTPPPCMVDGWRRASLQDGGAAHLQPGAVIVVRHVHTNEGEWAGGGPLQPGPELVAPRAGRGRPRDGPLQEWAPGDAGRLPAPDGPACGGQPAAGHAGSAAPGVLFGLAREAPPAPLPDMRHVCDVPVRGGRDAQDPPKVDARDGCRPGDGHDVCDIPDGRRPDVAPYQYAIPPCGRKARAMAGRAYGVSSGGAEGSDASRPGYVAPRRTGRPCRDMPGYVAHPMPHGSARKTARPQEIYRHSRARPRVARRRGMPPASTYPATPPPAYRGAGTVSCPSVLPAMSSTLQCVPPAVCLSGPFQTVPTGPDPSAGGAILWRRRHTRRVSQDPWSGGTRYCPCRILPCVCPGRTIPECALPQCRRAVLGRNGPDPPNAAKPWAVAHGPWLIPNAPYAASGPVHAKDVGRRPEPRTVCHTSIGRRMGGRAVRHNTVYPQHMPAQVRLGAGARRARAIPGRSRRIRPPGMAADPPPPRLVCVVAAIKNGKRVTNRKT